MSCDASIADALPELKPFLSGRVCLVGVGNSMKGDDGAGPALIGLLRGKVAATCVDAGVAPENFLEQIVRAQPRTVLVVDAMDFGGSPGETRLFSDDACGEGGLSSHAAALGLLGKYLRARIPCRVGMLGVQPASTAFDRPLSAPVAGAVRRLAALLRECLAATAGHNIR